MKHIKQQNTRYTSRVQTAQERTVSNTGENNSVVAASIPTSTEVLSAVQTARSNLATLPQKAIAARVIQRTLGNQVCTQLFQEKHRPLESSTDVVQENIPSIQKVIHVSNNTNVIQRRRIPTRADLTRLVRSGYYNVAKHRRGLAMLVRRSMAQLSAAQRTAVQNRARGALSPARFSALPTWQQNVRLAQAIHALYPRLRHGDPKLYLIGARTGTRGIVDVTNIATLVALANIQFVAIASGAHDTSIGQVFGTSNVATAKTNYANARTRMNSLYSQNKIVTDRSGYDREVGLSGLTNSSMIMVSARTIDNPTHKKSIITLIHESMHAGNYSTVGDRGYINDANFTKRSEADKLRNAAHYEVVFHRILGTRYAYLSPHPLPVFIPAGTTVGRVTAPPLTATQQGVGQALQIFRKAWDVGDTLHTFYMHVYLNRTRWNVRLQHRYTGAHSRARFRNTLPFWSKVEKMTIHRKATIKPRSRHPSRHPVSRIDVALSEGVVRKLAQAMSHSPRTQSTAQTFINSHTTASQRAAVAGNAGRIRNLLLRLVLRHRVGRITGTVTRDLAVVRRLAGAKRNDFSQILRPRNPNAFPYP